MKVSIGSKIISGPWGGGNLFAKIYPNISSAKGTMLFMICLRKI